MSSTSTQKNEHWSKWMASAQDGDNKAYHKLLTEITPVIRKFLFNRIFDKNSVEDILQEILIAIHRSRHTYNIEQPFDRWMFGVARYKMIDAIRKQTRIQSREKTEENFETFLESPTNTVSEAWSFDLEKALKHLPAKQRKILILTKIEGHSMSDVAKKMDMSESAVKVSAHRAFKKLKEWLIEYGYE